MAIIKGWLEYTKGSIGNITFRRGVSSADGKRQTVASQKVTSVTNPQSLGQCGQRMKISTLQHLYTAWSKAESNAYTNSKYGFDSRLRFLKNNLNADNEDIFIGPAPKGYSYPVPGIYKISSGSLPTSPQATLTPYETETVSLYRLYSIDSIKGVNSDFVTNWNEATATERETILDSDDYVTFMNMVRTCFQLENVAPEAKSAEDWTLQVSYLLLNASSKTDYDNLVSHWSHITSIKLQANVGRMIVGKYLPNNVLNTQSDIDFEIRRIDDEGSTQNQNYFISSQQYVVCGGFIVSRFDGTSWNRSTGYTVMLDSLRDTAEQMQTLYAESYKKDESVSDSDAYLNYAD